MYLNVILTIFVIVQVVTIILIYKWWGRYGHKLFNSFNLNKIMTNKPGEPKGPDLFGKIPDMGEMIKQLNQMSKMVKKK